MIFYRFKPITAFYTLFVCSAVFAKTLPSKIDTLLQENYPGTQIEVFGDFKNITSESLSYLGDNGKGIANFASEGKQFTVPFSAWVDVPVAKRKISPLEALSGDLFSIKRVDVSRGEEHTYRGLILSAKTPYEQYESKQTILAGTYPMLHMVQRVPDVRRGDAIKISFRTEGLSLSAPAIVQEPANFGQMVRIITRNNKKEFSGKLINKNLVEVSL